MFAEPFNYLTGSLFEPLLAGVGYTTPTGFLLLGFVIGLRHAIEADHVAAVSAIVASGDRKLGRAPVLGALWGLGHTATLFVAGLIVLVLAVSIPEKITGTMEFGVGVMLVYLGATTLTGFKTGKFLKAMTRRDKGHRHEHSHMHQELGISHSHEHDHHDHRHGHKSLIVGMIHGMAGSGALMLAVLSTIDSIPLGLGYIAIFGAGSMASMVAVSLLIGLPLAKARHRKLSLALRCTAAVIALAVGLAMIYQLGIVDQLFF